MNLLSHFPYRSPNKSLDILVANNKLYFEAFFDELVNAKILALVILDEF